MILPKVIQELIKAQDSYDSAAYADCFSETAVVLDEGKTHKGKAEIQNWISEGNEKYKTTMKPIDFVSKGAAGILAAEISGAFDGSPIVLKYHMEITDGLIQSLEITG